MPNTIIFFPHVLMGFSRIATMSGTCERGQELDEVRAAGTLSSWCSAAGCAAAPAQATLGAASVLIANCSVRE